MSGRTTININSQTVYANVDETDDLFNIFSGADLLLGNDIFTDDALAMSGFARFRAPITINDGLTLENTVTLVNASVVTQNSVLYLGRPSDIDTVTVRNTAGATWNMSDGAVVGGPGTSEFVNLGLLEQTGGTSHISAEFVDRGGTVQIDGTLIFSLPSRFVDDTITGTGVFDSTDDTLVNSAVSAALATDLTNGRIVGHVTISSDLFYAQDGLSFAAGSVLDLTNPDGTLALNSAQFTGLGTIEIKGDDTVTPSMSDQLLTYLVGGMTLDNYGNTTFAGPSTRDSSVAIIATAWSGDQVTIENHAGATWTDTGDSSAFYGEGLGSDVFLNDGTFVENSRSGATFALKVVNDDVMQVGPDHVGGLDFSDALTGTGTVEIGPDNVSTNSVVGSGQKLNFNPAPHGAPIPTLKLNDVQDFAATITGFDQAGATDDQIIANTATWTYQDFVANSGGGALMFSNGSSETAVNLTGTYDPLGFHAAVSGATTTITYTG